jgi:hypothetical protein
VQAELALERLTGEERVEEGEYEEVDLNGIDF